MVTDRFQIFAGEMMACSIALCRATKGRLKISPAVRHCSSGRRTLTSSVKLFMIPIDHITTLPVPSLCFCTLNLHEL